MAAITLRSSVELTDRIVAKNIGHICFDLGDRCCIICSGSTSIIYCFDHKGLVTLLINNINNLNSS